MKDYISRLLLVITIFILTSKTIQADIVTETEFSEPAEYCFSQTILRSAFKEFDRIFLDYNLIVNKEDHFKKGHVFVAFRQKSKPEKIWLFSGTSWKNVDSDDRPNTFPDYHPNDLEGKLNPVIPVAIAAPANPVDATPYIGDGEILVGYGLGENRLATYQDMIDNQRFKVIWDVSESSPFLGVRGLRPIICLSVTGMKEIIQTFQSTNRD